VKANRAIYSVRVMCRLLKISKNGFYAWLRRPISDRARSDIALTAKIHAIHCRSREAYGAPMIHAELADDHDIHGGRKRVAGLMRLAGLRGVQMKRFVRTTIPDAYSAVTVDRVDRRFEAAGPDRLWIADITYIPTWTGFLYLSKVLDVWSRRIVSWAMESHFRTELVLPATNMALAQRWQKNVRHHSDRGSTRATASANAVRRWV
jgi:putative transposase